jgi:hypothetical protein
MANLFSIRRCTELSTLDYLTAQIAANWSGITVVKSFNSAYDKTLNPPIVAAYLNNTNSTRLEIGSTTLDKVHTIAIDIFGTSDGNRIDLAEFIVNKLKDGWTYSQYGHPSGDNTTMTTSAGGRIYVVSFDQDTAVRFGDTVDVKDRFRHSILIRVRAVLT